MSCEGVSQATNVPRGTFGQPEALAECCGIVSEPGPLKRFATQGAG
jgi:hypothetical protein